jgi:hypothetical protein
MLRPQEMSRTRRYARPAQLEFPVIYVPGLMNDRSKGDSCVSVEGEVGSHQEGGWRRAGRSGGKQLRLCEAGDAERSCGACRGKVAKVIECNAVGCGKTAKTEPSEVWKRASACWHQLISNRDPRTCPCQNKIMLAGLLSTSRLEGEGKGRVMVRAARSFFAQGNFLGPKRNHGCLCLIGYDAGDWTAS